VTLQELPAHKLTHTRENSWWLNDAHGIAISRVCGECEDVVRAQYDPRIFNVSTYRDVVEEPIDDE
jgi:hypothetical protein